jgi:hypothetical protein
MKSQINVYGETSIYLIRDGVRSIIHEKKRNAIHPTLLENIASAIWYKDFINWNNTDFPAANELVLDTLFTSAGSSPGGTMNGFDGICVTDDSNNITDRRSTVTTNDSSSSVFYPSAPAITYKGEITFAADLNVQFAVLGKDFASGSFAGCFEYPYASQTFSVINALANDTLIIEWTLNFPF